VAPLSGILWGTRSYRKPTPRDAASRKTIQHLTNSPNGARKRRTLGPEVSDIRQRKTKVQFHSRRRLGSISQRAAAADEVSQPRISRDAVTLAHARKLPNGQQMRLLTRPGGGSLSFALFATLLMVGSPLLDACGKKDTEPSPAPSVQAQASVVVAATPAAATPATPAASAAPEPPGPPPAMASAEQLEQLVSPIALYPDVLVAQILAASTYPTQVVEAARWVKENPNLSGDQLASAVNPQPWDPSIKSLTQFPSVLQTMNESLAWTSELGEAYYNQPADVMNAIQVLRNRAINAGTLKTTPQQNVDVEPAAAPVSAQGGGQPAAPQQTVIIQPAQPNTVYVPQYNPSTVYGAPVQSPPGYTGTEMLATGLLSFGLGMALGALINNGNNNWNCNWGGGSVHYNNNVYVSHTNVVPGRGYYPGGYRPPYAGAYPPGRYPPGAYPPGGYPRPPGGYPRPVPYAGARPPYNGAVPSTRPYNAANAKQYAANNPNFAKPPTFPEASTLPKNSTLANPNRKMPQNQPAQPAKRPAQPPNRSVANQPAVNRPTANKPATGNRGADQMRGLGGGGDAKGGNTGALGGFQPAGLAQASSSRGRDSLSGQNRAWQGGNGGGGGGERARGGGGAGGGGGGARRRR
jgi:uncharacterized protein DUF3300